MADFPATLIVHWPSGSVSACQVHADRLVELSEFMNSPVAVTVGATGECANCRNEHVTLQIEVTQRNRVPLDSTSSPSNMLGKGNGDG